MKKVSKDEFYNYFFEMENASSRARDNGVWEVYNKYNGEVIAKSVDRELMPGEETGTYYATDYFIKPSN